MRRAARFAAGLLLVALAVAGVPYSLRASQSQWLYYRAKYGDWRQDHTRAIAAAQRAHQLYPWNYNLCIWAAESAYYGAWDAALGDRAASVQLAQTWCDRGLALNTYKSPLRLLEVWLTAHTALPEAIRKWEAYVDWHFWEPYNHAVLVDLYSRNGQYEQALASLAFVNDPRLEQEARGKLRAAWAAEIESMRALPAR